MLEVNIDYIKLINILPAKNLVEKVNFNLVEGNIYTILGKNGSGKTTLINSITKLLDKNVYEIKAKINFEGINIYEIDNSELLKLRKDKIRYVFQDSVNSFDPLKSFGYYFKRLNINEANLDNLLEYFLLPPSIKLSGMFPYEVSGGMAQRISASLAILSSPKLLILDEPTSALDITISNLLCMKLKEFSKGHNAAVLIITQDIDFAENVSDYIAFLNKGNLSDFSNKSVNRENWTNNHI